MRHWRQAGVLTARIAYLFLLLAAAARLPGIQATGLSPTMAHNLWESVRDAERKNHPDRALKNLVPLLQEFPQNPQYLYTAAENMAKLNRFAESAAAWEKYIRVAPTPMEACPHLGRAYEAVGDPDKALDAHRRCLAMDPSKSDLLLYLALALERRGQRVEAADGFRAILQKSPAYSDARLGLARIALHQGRVEEADVLSQSVLKISPGNSDALFVAALVCEKRDDPFKAITLLKRAIAIAPAYADLQLVLDRLCRNNRSPECPASP